MASLSTEYNILCAFIPRERLEDRDTFGSLTDKAEDHRTNRITVNKSKLSFLVVYLLTTSEEKCDIMQNCSSY